LEARNRFGRNPPVLITALLAVLSAAPRAAAQDPAAGTRPAAPASFDEAFALAQQADYPRLVGALRVALGFAPETPSLLYHLARAESLAGSPGNAIRALERLATQGAARDLRADSAFAPLHADPRFAAVERRLAEGAAAIVRSDSAFVIPDPDFIPEGIAYDPVGQHFLVGSMRAHRVVRVGPDGAVTDLTPPPGERAGQVIGLRVDAARRRLWAATLEPDSLAPRFRAGIGGWAALLAYDLDTGRVLDRVPAPDSTRPHLLNDLVVTPDGHVYVTDSEAGALYRLGAGERALQPVPGATGMTYPNGIALAADGSRLFVAHAEGLSTLALEGHGEGRLERMTAPTGVTTGGIDGLYACAGGLLAVQRMLDFQQITWFELSADGRAVAAARALERRHPAHDAATTGAIAGDHLHYIADAQLGRLRPDGSLAPADPPRETVVLRLPLDGLCAADPR
jgi:hypothetical protein